MSVVVILSGTRSDLNPLAWVAFLLLPGVMIGSGIATVVTLRRHPEMQHATGNACTSLRPLAADTLLPPWPLASLPLQPS